MTTVINLYGGPGTGKSTSASYLYYLLKSKSMNGELVREYVKDWAWDGRHIGSYDQIYFVGKQARHESMLYGKVDYVVTDSPVMLSIYYANKYSPTNIALGIHQLVKYYYNQASIDGVKHIHVFLNRTKEYVQAGRYQNLSEAKEIDNEMLAMLISLHIPYIRCGTTEDDLNKLFKSIVGTKNGQEIYQI